MPAPPSDDLEQRGRVRGADGARLKRRYLRAPLATSLVRQLAIDAYWQETSAGAASRWSATDQQRFVAAYLADYHASWAGKP
jgi:hypothetical protein